MLITFTNNSSVIGKNNNFLTKNKELNGLSGACEQNDFLPLEKIPASAIRALYFTSNRKVCHNKISFSSNYIPETDMEYRLKLAKELNCSPENLKSVVGINELTRDILPYMKFENFSPGKDFENVKNGTYRISLHMHTLHSDGNLTVQQMLDQAVTYADRINRPFYITISDHDTLEGAREALKIISSDPDKYKNLRLIPGIEFSAKYINNDLFKKPLQLEMLGYCINPFDKELNTFLETRRSDNFAYAEEILKKINDKMQLGHDEQITLEQAKKYALVRVGGSPGFIPALKIYILDRLENKVADQPDLSPILKKNGVKVDEIKALVESLFAEHTQTTGNFNLTNSTPAINEVSEIVKQSCSGKVGIAHPGWINFKHANATHSDEFKEIMREFLNQAKSQGVDLAEVNYQYAQDYFGNNSSGAIDWINNIRRGCQDADILAAGGLDTHSNCIFTNKQWLEKDHIEKLLKG